MSDLCRRPVSVHVCRLGRAGLGMVVAAAWLMGAAGHAAPPPDPAVPGDLELKAAFVLNFIRLVNWGTVAGESNPRELPVCAYAKSDFYNAVRNAAMGKTVGERAIVLRIEVIPDVRRCRVLLVDKQHYQSAPQVLAALRGAPVLTVGNGAGFLDAGGMFQLVVEDRKVQFETGIEAIRHSGLDVSARLLHLARKRTGGGDGN